MKIPKAAIFSILERLGLEPTDKEDYFLIRCPACGHKEMYMYKKGNRMVCNRQNKCGATYKFYDFIKESNIISTDEIKKEAALKLFDGEEDDKVEERNLEIPDGVKYFAETTEGLFRDIAFNYLQKRGIPQSRINNLGYVYEPSSMYNKTVFFPFYEDGVLVFYVCRDYTGTRFRYSDDGTKTPVRYLNPKGGGAGNYVYSIDDIEEGGDVFIFEGLMDALMLEHQVGTAMMKAHLSSTQASKIWNRMPGRVILVPDTDKAGQEALKRNISMIGKYKPPSLNSEILVYDIPKPYKDLNESGIHEIDINDCKPYSKMRALELFDWKIKAPL